MRLIPAAHLGLPAGVSGFIGPIVVVVDTVGKTVHGPIVVSMPVPWHLSHRKNVPVFPTLAADIEFHGFFSFVNPTS